MFINIYTHTAHTRARVTHTGAQRTHARTHTRTHNMRHWATVAREGGQKDCGWMCLSCARRLEPRRQS